jgi:hypothetical protein
MCAETHSATMRLHGFLYCDSMPFIRRALALTSRQKSQLSCNEKPPHPAQRGVGSLCGVAWRGGVGVVRRVATPVLKAAVVVGMLLLVLSQYEHELRQTEGVVGRRATAALAQVR